MGSSRVRTIPLVAAPAVVALTGRSGSSSSSSSTSTRGAREPPGPVGDPRGRWCRAHRRVPRRGLHLVERPQASRGLPHVAISHDPALVGHLPDPQAERAQHDPGVPGELPSPIDPPSECRFRIRCRAAQELCARGVPVVRPSSEDHPAERTARRSIDLRPNEVSRATQ